MRPFILLLVGLVLAGAIAVTGRYADVPPSYEQGRAARERSQREARARLVAGPMAAMERNDPAAASRLFEADLAKARDKGGRAAAELLDAYGDALRDRDMNGDRTGAAIPYLKRAVEAYRAVAPGSPELALALCGYGFGLYDLDETHPPPEAMAALHEALQIRERTLGRRNADTAMLYIYIGRLEGLPALTRGDPKRIEAAAAMIRTGIALLPGAPNSEPYQSPESRMELAKLYALNGDTPRAFAAAREYGVDHAKDPYRDRLEQVALVFEEAGDKATGGRFRREFALPDPPKPPDPNAPQDAPPTIKNAGRLGPWPF